MRTCFSSRRTGASLLHPRHLLLLYMSVFSLPGFLPLGVFLVFPFGRLEHHLLPLSPPGEARIHSSRKERNITTLADVEKLIPSFLYGDYRSARFCSAFLLAAKQLFPSSAYFSPAAALMVREYALMLQVSQRACANSKQMI